MVLWACRLSPGSHVSVNDHPQMEVLTWHFYQAWETLGTSGERVAPYLENMNTSTSEQLPLNHIFFSFKQMEVFQVPIASQFTSPPSCTNSTGWNSSRDLGNIGAMGKMGKVNQHQITSPIFSIYFCYFWISCLVYHTDQQFLSIPISDLIGCWYDLCEVTALPREAVKPMKNCNEIYAPSSKHIYIYTYICVCVCYKLQYILYTNILRNYILCIL